MPKTDIHDDVQSTLDSWQLAGCADVAVFVDENPSVVQFKSLLLDLIYEELCQDHAAGKPSRIGAHARAFPEYQESIRRLIEVHSLIDGGGQGQRAERIEFPKTGDVVAGLNIISVLGQGSFSRVYLAQEIDVGDRLVVAKFAAVLQHEAALLGKTPHPNIIPILRTQRVEDSPLQVICMPFLGIATLVDVLDVIRNLDTFPEDAAIVADELQKSISSDRAPVSVAAVFSKRYVDFVLEMGVQIADALAVMHEQAIVHCDIKPSNILLSWDGAAIVLDLNLSKSREVGQALDGGTLAYMAPERLVRICERMATNEAKPAEDIFSLGIVLFELLSGGRSVALSSGDAPDLADLLDDRRFDEWQHSPGRKIKHVIERCLSRKPEERPTAKELREELRSCLRPEQKLLRYGAKHRQQVSLALGSLLLVVAVLVGYVATRPSATKTAWSDGLAAYSSQQFDQATRRFSDGIEAGSPTVDFLFARGQSYLALGKNDPAEADFKAALEACQNEHDKIRILECLGYCQLLMRRFEAPATYNKLLDLDSKNTAALNNLAICLARTSSRDDALAAIEHAVKEVPNDPALRSTRAHISLSLSVYKNQPISPVAYEDVQFAKKAGRIAPYAAMDAAVITLGYNPSATDEALGFLEMGVEQGLPPSVVESQRQFEPLREIPRFQALRDVVPSAKSKGREWELAIPPSSSPLLGK